MSNESAEVELPHVYCATFTRVANEPHRSLADQVADRVIARIEDRASNLHSAAVASAGECERLRSQVAEPDRRIEDLRVSLIQAINTALSRAGVELPTSAAATVEPELSVGVDDILQAYAERDEAIKLRDNANRERDEALAQLELWRGSQWGEIARENADLRRRAEKAEQALAEATTWRPMGEHIAAPTIVAWRGEGRRVGVYGACNFGPLPKHQQTDALGWLPIPPYRAKEGQ